MARNTVKDSEVVLRVYEALREAAGPDDEWDIELALLEKWVGDFENAIDYGESDEEVQAAREAVEAAKTLRRAIMTLVAAPGAS